MGKEEGNQLSIRPTGGSVGGVLGGVITGKKVDSTLSELGAWRSKDRMQPLLCWKLCHAWPTKNWMQISFAFVLLI